MEYSPRNANPYIGRVDAGTIELVAVFGVELVSSGDLIQLFEATWDDDQDKPATSRPRSTAAMPRTTSPCSSSPTRFASEGPGDGNRRAAADHEALRREQDDDLQPADCRRRPAQRRPALRTSTAADRYADQERRSSCSSTSGRRWTGRGPFTRTHPRGVRRRTGAREVHEDLQHRRRGPRRGDQDA